MKQIDAAQIVEQAKCLTDHAFDELNHKWECLCCAMQDVKNAVSSISSKIECVPAEERFGKLCLELERLEICKRRMDECFSAFLGGEFLIVDATMKLLSMEGTLALSSQQDEAETAKEIARLRLQVEEFKETYAKKRAWAEQLIRRTIPHFLDEVYRVSDGEREGRGFRMQSLAALCGGLCNEIKIP